MLSFGIQIYFKTSPEGEPFQSSTFEQNEPVRKTGCFLDTGYMQSNKLYLNFFTALGAAPSLEKQPAEVFLEQI